MSPPRSLRAALAVVLAASISQCASAPAPAPVTAPAPAPTAAVEMAVDTSPVPRPDDAVVTIRIGNVRGSVRRLGEMLGLRDFIEEAVTTTLPDMLGDEAVAHTVDLDGPIDLVVVFRNDDVAGVASFPVRSIAEARAQLSDGHTLSPFGNPSLQLLRIVPAAGERSDALILAPAGSNGGGRLLMVHRSNGYEDVVNRVAPYITRTLAAQPLAPTDGAAVVEFHPQVLERSMHDELDHMVGDLVSQVSPGPDPNNPLFADAATAWLRDALGALRSTIAEARDARLSLDLTDAGATLAFDVGVQNPSAQLAQQALASLRDGAVPMELYERLPPGGWSYSAWSLHTEPLRATLNLGASAAARLLTPRSHLLADDATALRTALGALVAQDRVAVASTTGRDPQDRYTSTALVRVSTPSPQFVANVRSLVAVMRRPGVARAMRSDLHIDPMLWTLPPTTGLPAGSFMLRGTMPTLAELTTAVRGPAATTPAARSPIAARPTPGAPAARPLVSELLLVPEGDHVWVVLGGNARTQFAAATANHPAPPTVPDAAAAGTSSVAAMLPSLLTEAFRTDTTLLRTIRETLAHAGDAANAPSVGRLRLSEREGVTHVTADLAIPRAVLGLVGQSVQRSLAPSHQ